MTEAVQLELIKSIPSLAAMVSGVVAAYFAYRAHSVAKETAAVAKQTEENTNHLKDELVAEVRRVASLDKTAATKEAFEAGTKAQIDKQNGG